MASIYKRPGSKVWQCSYYATDPETGELKQVRQSTHKTDKREAKGEAADLERKAREKAGAGNEKSRRILEVLQRASQEAQKEMLNATRARQFLAEIVKISTGEDMPAFSIKTWLEEWKRRKAEVTAASTRQRYKASVKAFTDWLGDRADKPLESLTVTDIRLFREKLTSEGRAAKTAQHYVRDIGSALRTAVREGLLVHNPATGLDPLDTSETSISRTPFAPRELSLLVKHAPSNDWRGVILCGLYAGLRLGDAARLKWKSVDLAEGTLRLIPAKTKRKKREICIPLHLELRAFLEEHPSADDADSPVFPSLAKRSVSGHHGLSLTFVEIMETAGVSRGKARIVAKESAGRTTHEKGFHSLRHTYVSALANADVGEDVRMKLAGHSDSEAHAIYSHHEVKTLAAAIEKIPGLVSLEE
jgi:integrase